MNELEFLRIWYVITFPLIIIWLIFWHISIKKMESYALVDLDVIEIFIGYMIIKKQ